MKHDVDILRRLRQADFFSTLSDRHLKRVLDSGQLVTHHMGQSVVSQGRGGAGFHLVMEGSALVDIAGNERPSLGVGDHFGEISLLDGEPRTATITAGADGLVTFFLPSFAFAVLLDQHPEMSKPIIKVLCRRLREEHAFAQIGRA